MKNMLSHSWPNARVTTSPLAGRDSLHVSDPKCTVLVWDRKKSRRQLLDHIVEECQIHSCWLEELSAIEHVERSPYCRIAVVALGTYLLMSLLTLVSLWRIQRKAKQRYFTSWITNYAIMFEATWVAFVVGSTFLNRAHFDLAYHWIALVVAFEVIAEREMAN